MVNLILFWTGENIIMMDKDVRRMDSCGPLAVLIPKSFYLEKMKEKICYEIASNKRDGEIPNVIANKIPKITGSSR